MDLRGVSHTLTRESDSFRSFSGNFHHGLRGLLRSGDFIPLGAGPVRGETAYLPFRNRIWSSPIPS